MTKKLICAIDHCDNEVKCPESGLCKTCYHGMYYWTNPKNRKSPTDILRYQKKLQVRAARMRTLSPVVIPMRIREKVAVRVR